ncbi:MAG: hypothetical protein L3J31_00430 [Bacteroidales bacterium]|nr:hypothetical protein [Bacteroidales bacterium]MCF6341256.1 hypothetical protein [Bacteroidales bacterium]
MMNFGNMGWGMGFGWLLGLFLLGLFFWLVLNTIQSKNNGSNKTDAAKEILRKRFAESELSKKEFEEMSKDLDGNMTGT